MVLFCASLGGQPRENMASGRGPFYGPVNGYNGQKQWTRGLDMIETGHLELKHKKEA